MKKQIGILVFALLPLIAPAQSLEQLDRFLENEAQNNNEFLRKQLSAQAQMTPNQELYDVHFYSIEINVLPEIKKLEGEVSIRAHSLSSLESMELNFAWDNTVNGVFLAEHPDSALDFQHEAGRIYIQLDKTYAEGEEVKILVSFSAADNGRGLTFMNYLGQDMIFSFTESKDWFPCKHVPADKADSCDITVTVPKDLVVASNGLLKEVSHTDTSSTYYWQERYPIATYLMSIAIYPYEIRTDWYVNAAGDSMEIQMFTIPEKYEQLKDNYSQQKETLAFFEARFGPYPFFEEKYGHAEIHFGSSEEHQTMTSFSITSLRDYPNALITHELAHSWFGNSVTNESFHHVWFQEGGASYAQILNAESKENPIYTPQEVMGFWEYYGPGTIYVEDPETQPVYDKNLSYNKAAWVYHMLRHMVGDTVFFNILRSIISDPDCAYGTINTHKFREISEEVSGMKLDKFFQQWIYGQYYPDYTYSWTYAEKDGGYELELTLNQVQEWQLFWMPVDVAVQTANGVERFVAWDSLETQVFHLAVNDLPLSVELDPDNWLLNKASELAVVISVTGVSLDQHTLDLQNGDTAMLFATVAPPDATDPTLNWWSGDDAVATVNENGEVTANSVDSTYIYVSTKDGGYMDSCRVTVTPGTGVMPSQAKHMISIYPNPVSDILNIYTGFMEIHRVEISTIAGQLLESYDMDQTIFQIDLSSLQRGIYLIRIKFENQIVTRKIIKY